MNKKSKNVDNQAESVNASLNKAGETTNHSTHKIQNVAQVRHPIEQKLEMENKKMTKKNVIIHNPIGSAIQPSPGFAKKQLADYHLELAALCEFGCMYCSTDTGPGTVFKIQTLKKAAKDHYPSDFAAGSPNLHNFCKTYSISYHDILSKLEMDLDAMDPEKTRGQTLMFGQLVDNFAPGLMKSGTTAKALELILNRTHFRIRCLSKSISIAHDSLMYLYTKYPDRFVVGLSIGTLDKTFAHRIERHTSLPEARLSALGRLQVAGVETYGMLCPVFRPTLAGKELERLLDRVNPELCEHIWVEPYNDRKNWRNVQKALGADHSDYEWLPKAYGPMGIRDPAVWSSYATELYTRVRDKAQSEGWINKLRYLLYEGGITVSDASEFEGHIGKDVLLQDKVDGHTGKTKNQAFAPFDPRMPKVKNTGARSKGSEASMTTGSVG